MGPMLMLLACIGDPIKAEYTVVQGTNSVNASTGTNTFTAGNTGKHQYVVVNLTTAQCARTLDAIFEKRSWPSRKNIGVQQIPKLSRVTSTVDAAHLLGYWCADDLVGNTNSSSVYHLEDRNGVNHFRAVAVEVPTYVVSE